MCRHVCVIYTYECDWYCPAKLATYRQNTSSEDSYSSEYSAVRRRALYHKQPQHTNFVVFGEAL